jgi:hypothetical protein
MENSLVDGYGKDFILICLTLYAHSHPILHLSLIQVSEKIFNGALGSGIPIYFGAQDVGSFINPQSFVHCNVSRSVIEEMRTFYPRAMKPRPFLFDRASTGFFPTEEELFHWADGYLRTELEPCVQRVIELDGDDSLYKKVVSEPFITNPDILSGQYPFGGVRTALDALKT